MSDYISKEQKFFPDFGYSAPIRTEEKCKNPAMKDHHLHRIGLFQVYQGSIIKKCVNCGRKFETFVGGGFKNEVE